MLPLAQRLNEVRRAHRPLQRLDELQFLETENEQLLAYARGSGPEALLCCVNLDPYDAQEGVVIVPVGLGTAPAFHVEDLLSGERYDWRLGRNYVRLEPGRSHVLAVVHR